MSHQSQEGGLPILDLGTLTTPEYFLDPDECVEVPPELWPATWPDDELVIESCR